MQITLTAHPWIGRLTIMCLTQRWKPFKIKSLTLITSLELKVQNCMESEILCIIALQAILEFDKPW